MRIAINGFGRLGRGIAREIFKRQDVELVAINDLKDWDNLIYLLQFDSTHGSIYKQNILNIDRQECNLIVTTTTKTFNIKLLNTTNPNFEDIDIVIESNGIHLNTQSVKSHIQNGAKKVIIGANPTDDITPIFVLGANESKYRGENIISNGSCTTNAIAPLFKILDERFGIASSMLSTIHSYTSDQVLLDSANTNRVENFRKSRSASNNIIPLSTISASMLYKVLPNLKDKISGVSLRIPIQNVAMADITFVLNTKIDIDTLNQTLEQEIGKIKNILGFDTHLGVSSDFVGDTHSSIIAKDLSKITQGNLLKMMLWYDNEIGYANRIIDMSKYILGENHGI